MKKLGLLLFGILVSLGLTFAKTTKKEEKNTLKTENDSVSYALGVNVGSGLKDQLKGLPGKEVNADVFLKALTESFKGAEDMPTKTNQEAVAYLEKYFAKAQEAESNQNKDAGEAFLANNKKRAGVITTESGLQYEVVIAGAGAKPTGEDVVKVHYRGTLIDGTEFDSSYSRNEPAVFGVDQVIPGWTEALQLMSVGSKWKIYLPYNLAYGERGAGGEIKPYSTLIFDVELLDIEK